MVGLADFGLQLIGVIFQRMPRWGEHDAKHDIV